MDLEPISPAPQVPEVAQEKADYQLEFSGNASEYFRIWIVNIALTIATLGIYSAWAKVRNKQYFYAQTQLAGSSFEYTANPVAILKGRALVISVFTIYQLASYTQPVLGLAMAVALIPLVPWIVIQAIGFNLRYSAYRNLRFHFDGTYWQAFKLYILWTIAIGISFGIAYPYVAWQRKQFFVNKARFGNKYFKFSGEAGYFYVVYICAVVIYIGATVGLSIAIGGFSILTGMPAEQPEAQNTILIVLVSLGFTVMFVTFNSAIQSLISNFMWQHTALKGIQFSLNLNVLRVVWIQISNIAVIIFSLGLLIPWAKVRMLRYQLSRFSLSATPQEFEHFIATERDNISATGGEFGEVLDLDLGL
jgi:uncharacterized membrane protein YjgN (DUF898 family)